MKIAITTDWLTTKGGAERVLTEFLNIWPVAPIFTTVYNPTLFADLHVVYTGNLQKWYRLIGNHRVLLPWMPRAVESWDLRGYDVILSSSHAVAKGCIPPSTARHICYCHTPMRYAWEMEEEYLDDFKLRGPVRSLVKRELQKMREWDLTTAKRVDTFIANSHETARRIEKIYGRDSIVLHPPVDDRFFANELSTCHHQIERYYLSVGRLVPYKRFDLAIEAANRERFPLKIAGTGPEEARLKKIAGPTVEFLGHAAEEELPALYANAHATIFPVHEDAGIVPLESQVCGTPVIAYGRGGVLDTIKDGGTGLFFGEQTVDSLIDALRKFETIQFDATKIREHAKQFCSEKFRERLQDIVM